MRTLERYEKERNIITSQKRTFTMICDIMPTRMSILNEFLESLGCSCMHTNTLPGKKINCFSSEIDGILLLNPNLFLTFIECNDAEPRSRSILTHRIICFRVSCMGREHAATWR